MFPYVGSEHAAREDITAFLNLSLILEEQTKTLSPIMSSVETPRPTSVTPLKNAASILTLPLEIMDDILDWLCGTDLQMLRHTSPALKAKVETRPYKVIIIESRASKERVKRIAEVPDEARKVKTAFFLGDEWTRRHVARHCPTATMLNNDQWKHKTYWYRILFGHSRPARRDIPDQQYRDELERLLEKMPNLDEVYFDNFDRRSDMFGFNGGKYGPSWPGEYSTTEGHEFPNEFYA